MRLLVIDNYDSFTYNLVQYVGELGAEVEVVRNDRMAVDDLLSRGYDRVIVSPGRAPPTTPASRWRRCGASRRRESPPSASASATRRWSRPGAAG